MLQTKVSTRPRNPEIVREYDPEPFNQRVEGSSPSRLTSPPFRDRGTLR